MQKAQYADCDKCPLKDRPFVPSCGPKNPELVIVGEAPGQTEVEKGEPFVGMSGRLLTNTLQIIGFDRTDVYFTNAVLCHPENNATPDETAVKCCHKRLINELKQLKPKSVLAVGVTAAHATTGRVITMLSQRGQQLHSEYLNRPVNVTVHPAYVLRQPNFFTEFRRDVAQAAKGIVVENINTTRYVMINTLQELKSLLKNITGPLVAYDTETYGLNPYVEKRMICLQLTEKPGVSYVVTENAIYNPASKRLISQFFARTDLTFVGTNLKFDNKWLMAVGIQPPVQYDDTMLMHYVTDERRGTHGLKKLGYEYLKVGNWEQGLEPYIKAAKAKKTTKPRLLPSGVTVEQTDFEFDSYGMIPREVLYPYAARDTDINWRLHKPLTEEIDALPKGRWLYENVLLPASKMFERWEHRGMLINRPLLDQSISDYTAEKAKLKLELQKLCGRPEFNPASPKQLQSVLYDDLKLPVLGYTPKKAPSTAAPVLDALIEMHDGHEFLSQLLLYRAVSKILDTYLLNILWGLDRNSRTHASMMIHGTVTGRFVEKMWLLLPRPAKNRFAAVVRNLVIADPGFMILAPDYDQAELRVVTKEAQEPIYQQIFLTGGDPHAVTTDELYGTDWRSLPTKAERDEYRTAGKTLNFGVLYGIGAKKFASQAKLDIATAKHFIAKYFAKYTQVDAFMKQTRKLLREQGYLENHFGRRRHFELIVDDQDSANADREGPNFIIQSTANELNTLSAITIDRELDFVQGLQTYHDAIITQAPENRVDEAARLLVEIMQGVPVKYYTDYVPFTVDVKVGPSWGEAK